jgi:Na+/H+-dicarboxylate symporter
MQYSGFMKIWVKYLIGSILGIIAAIILPLDSGLLRSSLDYITEFTIKAGRYMLIPLVFFSMTIAVFELRETRQLLRTAVYTGIVILISSLFLTLLGMVSVLVIKIPRIPISIETVTDSVSLNLPEKFMSLLPDSVFDVFHDGAFLVPLFVFAGFAGAGCAADKGESKPVLAILNSLSHVFYAIMNFFIDILGIGIIAVSCSWAITFFSVYREGTFNMLFLLFAIDFGIVIFAVYPLLIRLVCKERNPYRILYAGICSILTAFISGDTNLVLPINMRHAKESLGVRRRINSVTMPIFSAFARGGSALTVSVSFVVILQSYSSLGISVSDLLWIAGASFLLSLLLGSLPVGGPFISLTILCTMYGRGFEAGYLLMKPAAAIICSFAAAFDAASAIFGTYLIARNKNMVQHREIRKFI